jgi:5-methyltetrahydropteroyltriglutamate--homocysteine methyltransferase
MHRAIDRALEAQESAGVDVLVHGEPERNDMVEYFGAELAGMATTDNGWVQSYGSRCVKPPLIYGDVYRKGPITRDWIAYAQSRTDKPVKGMLTGPVTIMKWSFVRDDLDPATVTEQIAWALHDEVSDLDHHGVAIIQIDEPAFREAMPLRAERRPAYVAWATRAFRVAASAATAATQIHTHMCYSELDDVLDAIRHSIGPGVYDVHSPEVPREVDIERRIAALLAAVPARRLWVNPDCGLKTRRYEEVLASLVSMVAAAWRARATLPI